MMGFPPQGSSPCASHTQGDISSSPAQPQPFSPAHPQTGQVAKVQPHPHSSPCYFGGSQSIHSRGSSGTQAYPSHAAVTLSASSQQQPHFTPGRQGLGFDYRQKIPPVLDRTDHQRQRQQLPNAVQFQAGEGSSGTQHYLLMSKDSPGQHQSPHHQHHQYFVTPDSSSVQQTHYGPTAVPAAREVETWHTSQPHVRPARPPYSPGLQRGPSHSHSHTLQAVSAPSQTFYQVRGLQGPQVQTSLPSSALTPTDASQAPVFNTTLHTSVPSLHTSVSSLHASGPSLHTSIPSLQTPSEMVSGEEADGAERQGSDGQFQYQVTSSSSSAYQQYRLPPPEHSPSDVLDKKPTLQVMTDHSPGGSPGSSTSSPRFIFPDMQRSSSSGHLASDSGSSPFMSPVKCEVKWEVGTPPHAAEHDVSATLSVQQACRERASTVSGEMEAGETLVDSETGSSLLEDSSSSREQSPFSAMAETLSLRSPSEHSPSPLARKVFHRHVIMLGSEDEEVGVEEEEGGGDETLGLGHHSSHIALGDAENNPPKLFKKRLHERYVMSLQDCPRPRDRVKVEAGEGEGEGVSLLDPKRHLAKMERPDSPLTSESSLPKSPRRSSSDTDNVRSETLEMGASSADEGDVFMEPKRVRTKTRPPSLHHQREPLDLSRGNIYSGFRSSSGSSPLADLEHLGPSVASKHFSPPSVFRSPHHLHRLPPHHQYSPHQVLLSPQQQQSQSPLCSVPEGGRIFNFNMPSPLEGAHSDSDLISPSPLSPRVFTFPPQGIMNPMAEVNRLAVSPRAPYTPPPPFLHAKGLGVGGLEGKSGDGSGFYGKRSLSESDMTYLCPVCGQVFPTNDNLAKHMAKHLPTETVRSGDNKVHYCKVCNRSFSRSDMLTRHMRLHTGLKPYECGDCGQVFSRSDHLNTHRRTHTGEKPYRCPQCPYAACRRDMITRHMRTHVKRTSRRARYLSVPDEGEGGHKSGSVSSTEATDRESVGRHTCSVSSVDSVDSECPPPSSASTRQSYVGASVDSLLSPEPEEAMSPLPPTHYHHPLASPSHRPPGDGDKSGYERFLQYRKARNFSTTSLESVDLEEVSLVREVFVDDADIPAGGREGREMQGAATAAVGPDAHSLQSKCFISRNSTGSSGGSS